MNKDFEPGNVKLWITNWGRKFVINDAVRQWLNTFDFEDVNIIVNKSGTTIEDFDQDLRSKVKLWPNVLRHDRAFGPMTKDINSAYIHTFLEGKKYCMFSHDNMLIRPGWDKIIKDTNYLFYLAPQGDQIHIMSLDGLRRFGWWDERYSTVTNFELDYIARALKISFINGENNASLVDYHSWEDDRLPNERKKFHYKNLNHNSVGLENFWERKSIHQVPKTEVYRRPEFTCIPWHDKKWGPDFPSYEVLKRGPLEEEVEWYPWLHLDTLTTPDCGIT